MCQSFDLNTTKAGLTPLSMNRFVNKRYVIPMSQIECWFNENVILLNRFGYFPGLGYKNNFH